MTSHLSRGMQLRTNGSPDQYVFPQKPLPGLKMKIKINNDNKGIVTTSINDGNNFLEMKKNN